MIVCPKSSLLFLLLSLACAAAAETPLKWMSRQPVPFAAYDRLRASLDAAFQSTKGRVVSDPAELRAALARARPGDRILVRRGTHRDWGHFVIDRGGTAEAPVVIGPERPHEATFTGDICFTVRAQYVVLHGFDFVGANGRGSRFKWAVICLEGGDGLGRGQFCRIAGCRFLSCGWAVAERPPGDEAGSKYLVQSGAANTRVDHCYFHDRQGTAINYAHTEEIVERDLEALYLADHNIFRDSSKLWARGVRGRGPRINREAVSIWGGHPHQAAVFLRLCAEYNIFDHEVGDDNVHEIMTVKASGTVWRHNVFANGPGGVSFRTGRSSTVYGNVLANADFSGDFGSHQIQGAHHLFVNNYVIGNVPVGLTLALGDITRVIPHKETRHTFLVCEPVERCVFAHNAFLGNGEMGLGISPYSWSKRERAPQMPRDNAICNNLFVQRKGIMLDLHGAHAAPLNRIHHNWFHNTRDARSGDAGQDARHGDPGLTAGALPRLGPSSPARSAGAADPNLPDGFYGEGAPERIPVGPIGFGRYAFDYDRVPHIPPSKDVLRRRPLQAAFACLPKRQTPGRYILFDGGISGGRPTEFSWDFGDGTAVTDLRGALPHYYDRPGRYKVTLTVTDADGRRSTVSAHVEIRRDDTPAGAGASPGT